MIYQDDLKQIYCSYSRTQNLEWFSTISVIIFKVNIVAEHVIAKRMTIVVLFCTEIKQTILNSLYSKSETWAAAGGERAFAPLEIGTKNQNFIENLTSAAQFRLIDLIISMTVYLPFFSAHIALDPGSLFWCHAVMSLQVAYLSAEAGCETASGLLYCWSLLWNNDMATNLLMFTSSYDSRRFATYMMRLMNADILARNAARQWLLIAASRDARDRGDCLLAFHKGGNRAEVSFTQQNHW